MFYTNVDQYHNYILISGYDKNKRIFKKEKFKPSLFLYSNENSKYRDLYGKNVSKIQFESIKEARDFVKENKNQEILGMQSFKHAWISDNFKNEVEYSIPLLKKLFFDIEVEKKDGYSTVEEARNKITAISATYGDGIYYVFSYNDYDVSNHILKDKESKIIYKKCESEEELILSFINDVWIRCGDTEKNLKKGNYPDIVTGWNVNFFDIPYLINRITQLDFFSEDGMCPASELIASLSPFGIVKKTEKFFRRKKQNAYDIVGLSILDYYECYFKFTYKDQESVKLNNIAFVELGEEKLNYEEYKNLENLYRDNFQKFINYNIKDVELVVRIDKKTGIHDMMIGLSYDSKINFTDTFYQVRMWDVICFNELRKNNIVIPMKHIHEKAEKFKGAFCKEPIPNQYNWIVSYDIESLYPSIMMQLNISPETMNQFQHNHLSINQLIEKEDYYRKKDICVAANGQEYFTNIEGFIPALLKRYFKQRKEYKNEALKYKKLYQETKNEEYLLKANIFDIKQKARKINLNSNYGAFGSEYFRYYNIRNAEAVTKTGQVIIKTAEKHINIFLNKIFKTKNIDYVIAMDTDSMFLNLEKCFRFCKKENPSLDEKINFVEKFSREIISPFINKIFDDIYQYIGGYEKRLRMNREIIAEKGIWLAKKHYITKNWIVDDIKLDKPKYKIMGIECVKAATIPHKIREKMKKLITLIMEEDENSVIDFIEEFKNSFKTMNIDDIAFPKGMNGIDKYYNKETVYKKGTPIHVRGALLYNYFLEKLKLTKKYEKIMEGDKVKFIYLKLPNPIQKNVISFSDFVPSEFNIEKYIDYELQFEKIFLLPIKSILDVIGWNYKKVNTLESLF